MPDFTTGDRQYAILDGKKMVLVKAVRVGTLTVVDKATGTQESSAFLMRLVGEDGTETDYMFASGMFADVITGTLDAFLTQGEAVGLEMKADLMIGIIGVLANVPKE